MALYDPTNIIIIIMIVIMVITIVITVLARKRIDWIRRPDFAVLVDGIKVTTYSLDPVSRLGLTVRR